MARAATGINRDRGRSELVNDLTAAVRGDVDGSAGIRAMYGADASNYRRIPAAVVFPRDANDITAVLDVCRAAEVPLTMRGGGTSVAGNAIGPGVVLDTSRHMTGIGEIDPDRRTAYVEPGVVLADLQRAAAPYGLRFGPDPSTANRCTIGGMIGNNACGNHSVAWGTTADNVVALDVLTAGGKHVRVGDAGTAGQDEIDEIIARLADLERSYRDVWRTQLPAFSRRISGYGVDHLLAERGRSVARALVGSEGTCAVTVGATVQLVAPPPGRVLVVAGFLDDVAAADAVPTVLEHAPLAVEGLDAQLLDVVRTRSATYHHQVRGSLPAGNAWLFVELGEADVAAATDHARELARALGDKTPLVVVTDPAEQARLWKLRSDGAGLATRDASGGEAWPGWEDAAVPPENLGSYLRAFRGLLHKYDLRALSYGHFGDGCIHARISFDLATDEGVAVFNSFLTEAADTVVEHGGSLCGEHGDGLARSALLGRMYSPAVLSSFAEFKRIWDPAGLLNPGVVVDPPAVDRYLRQRAPAPVELPAPVLRYPDDDGDLGRALRRCVGVGACRADTGSVMCPSWLVTRDEKHTTRGRARLLQEIVGGDAISDGWRSKDALEALDLCLSCKGCSSDCPVGVDMAVYKAEFLHQHYRHRLRPRSHLTMGWLPAVARVASMSMASSAVVNAVTRSPARQLLAWLGGIDQRRSLPAFARRSFLTELRERKEPLPPTTTTTTNGAPSPTRDVVLWPDTFGNHFSPQVLWSGLSVLRAAGMRVHVPNRPVCCGLTWFSTGQLGVARRALERTAGVLAYAQARQLPMVVLEPSCATMLRAESRTVLGDTPFTRYLADHVVTLGQALEQLAPAWDPPRVDRPAVGQVHCHQSSVLGFDADERMMARAGITSDGMQRSCCGLAGNFGFEDGHYDVSRACAERLLLPAIERAPDDALVMADGFSCRTQIDQLGARRAYHLAEVLAEQL